MLEQVGEMSDCQVGVDSYDMAAPSWPQAGMSNGRLRDRESTTK